MKKLFVVPKADMVRETQALFTGHVDVLPVAANVAGTQYDEIWVDQDYQKIYSGDNLAKAEEQVRLLYTRLTPHGRMRFIQ